MPSFPLLSTSDFETPRRISIGGSQTQVVVHLPEGTRCPVCGDFSLSRDHRGDSVVDLANLVAGRDYYVCEIGDICPTCGCDYGCDATLGKEPAVFEENSFARRNWLDRFGRCPEVIELLWQNLGLLPDEVEDSKQGVRRSITVARIIADQAIDLSGTERP